MVLAGGIGLIGAASSSAAPANGPVIDTAANALLSIDQVHCRKYPHRHWGAKPHGLGFGCPKKPAGKTKKS